jgi:hypothetical protein
MHKLCKEASYLPPRAEPGIAVSYPTLLAQLQLIRPFCHSFISSQSHGQTAMRTLRSTALLSPSSRAIAKARLKQVLDSYIHHRPTVQRLLTAGFVLYCLGTTYKNLSGKGAKGGARERVSKRGKQGRSSSALELTGRWEEESIGLRPTILRSIKEIDSDRHSLHTVERGSDVSSSLCLFVTEDWNQSLCR